MAAYQEGTLPFSVESLQKISGFSLDIGGSVCKVVYRHKDDWDKLQKAGEGSKTGKLRLAWFRSEDADEALEMLKKNCHIHRTADNPTPTVYSTGIGANQTANKIREVLEVELKNLSEYDCQIDGYLYLSQHLSMEQFTYSVKEAIIKKAQKVAAGGNLDHGLPCCLRKQVEFPSILVMCGSGVATIKIERNGDFAAPDGTNIVGRLFIGMGSLLTRAKTYDELIDLASKGNNRSLDLCDLDLSGIDSKSEDITADEYKSIVSHFYKATGKNLDSFKREDLALSLLHMVTQQLAQFVIYSALRSKCYQIFFGGSFFNRELVRDVTTASFVNRLMGMAPLCKKVNADIGFHFLRYGSHLGAVGAMVSQLSDEGDK